MPQNLKVTNIKSDGQLVADFIAGDKQALEALFKRYLKPTYYFIYRYVANKEEAEDVIQETFVKVWKNLKKFDQKKSFKTWVFSIAKNTALDFLKKKKAIPFSSFEDEEGQNPVLDALRDPGPISSELIAEKEAADLLYKNIDNLSPKYREVLLLRLDNQLVFREIAAILKEPLHTVKSRYRRALILLKNAPKYSPQS